MLGDEGVVVRCSEKKRGEDKTGGEGSGDVIEKKKKRKKKKVLGGASRTGERKNRDPRPEEADHEKRYLQQPAGGEGGINWREKGKRRMPKILGDRKARGRVGGGRGIK